MNAHILIVDDEVTIRELLTGYLTANGYRVTAASSVHEAIRLAQKEPPHLLISDLQLEDGDGFEIIEHVKRHQPDLPVILLTGVLFEEEVVEQVIRNMVNQYLAKTTPLAQIGECIKELLAQRPG